MKKITSWADISTDKRVERAYKEESTYWIELKEEKLIYWKKKLIGN